MDKPEKPLLSSRGHIFVTLAVANTYADHQKMVTDGKLDTERARRELTERLLDARLQSDGEAFPGDNLHARARSRAWGLDLDVRCVIEGRLVVVVTLHIRKR